jgi:NitT/TauT family transport system substrate-binding protein
MVGLRLSQAPKIAILGMMLTMLLATAPCGSRAQASTTHGPITVHAGWVKVLQWTHWAVMPRYIRDKNVTVQMNDFKTSNEALVGLLAGSLDITTMGYNQIAAALTRGRVPFTVIAGASSGGSKFVAAPDSRITSWASLKGKRIGSARGSTQYMQLVAAMARHGLDINRDVQFVNLGGGTDMDVALKNHSVDAIMDWEPYSSAAIVGGYGVEVPAIQNELYSDSFKVSSGIVVRNDFMRAHSQVVQEIIDAYYKAWRKITTDHQYWIRTFSALTGADPKVLNYASRNAFPDFGMNEADIKNVARVLYHAGALNQDVSSRLAALLDYDFIAKASGQTPQQLGKAR